MAWEIEPAANNIIIEKEEFAPKEEEETGFVLPEDQKEQMELDQDGLYKVLKAGSDVEFVERGDIVVIPNRTVGEFDLPNDETGKYVDHSRIVAKIYENEE